MPKDESFLSSSRARKSWRWPSISVAVLGAVLFGLGACNPVDTWRDLTGVSRNDPDPEATPNTKNLAAGAASDYPNLATVPPPPVRALTAAEREKLTQSLIADRANARHSDEQLRAGFPPVAAAPPPPPGSSPELPLGSPAGETASQSASVAAAPESSSATRPVRTTDLAGTVKPLPGPTAAAAPDTAPSVASSGAGAATDVPSPTAASRQARLGRKTPAEPGQGLRPRSEPPEPGPMESSLEVPQARAVPQPEQVQPAPPPPQLPPTPRVAAAPTRLPGGLSAGGALAPTPLTDVKSSAGYEPPPTAPELPPVPPPQTAAVVGKSGAKTPARTATPVAEIKFGADATSLSDKDRQTLETVLPAYQQNPGKVRIVGYAATGGGAAEQLDTYRTALERAQAVAAALTKAGIPSDKIQVEAAPQAGSAGENRAEVLLEH